MPVRLPISPFMTCPERTFPRRNLFIFVALLAHCSVAFAEAPKPTVSFAADIQTLFSAKCDKCHRPGKTSGGLDLTSYEVFKKGGKGKTPFVAGKPGESLIVKMITGDKPKMPKEGAPLSRDEVGLIETWILEGALDDTPTQGPAPVSYTWNLLPMFKKKCMGCHRPGKTKGDLDMTSYSLLMKGGKEGPGFVPGHPEQSQLVKLVSGTEPDMPAKGDPLSSEQVALITRWITEGANDDTPPPTKVSVNPPKYTSPPAITSIKYSDDGEVLAVAAYHEVILHASDGSGAIARLIGGSPRIETVSYSADGTWLAVCGGAPGEFGEVQIWDVATRKLAKAFRIGGDSLFGVSFSLDGNRIAVGSADNTARVIDLRLGKETMKFENHDDWVFCTTWTADGKSLLTGSRDRAMKLIDIETSRFVDDVNKLLEPILCFERHPTLDQVVYGGALGTPRIYKISDNQRRTAANNDTNLIRAFERQPGPVTAIAYSPDGATIAVGSLGDEVRLYNTTDGKRTTTLLGHGSGIFAIDFRPDGSQIATGGHDGMVRLFDAKTGKLLREFNPVSAEHLSTIGKVPDNAQTKPEN